MGDPYRKRPMMSQEPSMGDPYRKRSMTHGYEYKNCDGDCSPLLKLTVPDYVCGSLLGRGGSQLKEFISQNGGNIRISNPGDRYVCTLNVLKCGGPKMEKNAQGYQVKITICRWTLILKLVYNQFLLIMTPVQDSPFLFNFLLIETPPSFVLN